MHPWSHAAPPNAQRATVTGRGEYPPNEGSANLTRTFPPPRPREYTSPCGSSAKYVPKSA